MNKLSAFGLGMAIGLTWFVIIIFVGDEASAKRHLARHISKIY